jgi:hypothetical protein
VFSFSNCPLPTCQTFLPSALLPIRPGEGADDPADGAEHLRPEGWHRHRIVEGVHVHHRVVLTIEQSMLASISSWLTAFLPGAPTAAT